MTTDKNDNQIEIIPSSEEPKPLIPATRDTIIHYLFGSVGNEDILRDFINAVLENDNLPLLRSVEMRNPFNPQKFITDKYTILDVKATSLTGEIFVVEFQRGDHPAFAERMLYYCCKTYSSQMSQGDEYTKLLPVIGIAVTTFIVEQIHDLPGIHNSFYLCSKQNHKVVFSDRMQMHVIEVVKEKIHLLNQLKPQLRGWVQFFYYAHQLSEVEMQTIIQDNPALQRAYEEYRRFNNDDEKRALDEAHQQYLHDVATKVEAGEIKGKMNMLMAILQARFNEVPSAIIESLEQRTDVIAFDSLGVLAATCSSLDEFAEALK
ncbi:MAG: Rpn family recombination-promoting nuclease/putative transposase [Planctomycetaceae bacterium]|jgi:predicted transposase/invertase (TIGR01784 family)|nr:Rpn family recombination-promoting nuclease/putative transposase [Planctomycetaceae bacterium]